MPPLDKLLPKIQRRSDGEGQGRRSRGWGPAWGSAGQAEPNWVTSWGMSWGHTALTLGNEPALTGHFAEVPLDPDFGEEGALPSVPRGVELLGWLAGTQQVWGGCRMCPSEGRFGRDELLQLQGHNAERFGAQVEDAQHLGLCPGAAGLSCSSPRAQSSALCPPHTPRAMCLSFLHSPSLRG